VDLQADCEEAFREYMAALQDAWAQPEIQEQGAEAYNRYLNVVQEACGPEVQQRVAQEWQRYERVVRSALGSTEMQQRVFNAFRDYVIALRGAWTDTAPEAIDAATLTAVCQNILTAAWIAGAAGQPPAASNPNFQQAMNPFQPSLG